MEDTLRKPYYRQWILTSTTASMLDLVQRTHGWSAWGKDILALYQEMVEAQLE